MSHVWEEQFRHRMEQFAGALSDETTAVSIKVRVSSGCFHREHSPEAYRIIDTHLSAMHQNERFAFEEHESGPEIIAYLALGTAGLTLAKSVLDLVIAIIKARSDGIKRGDRPDYPIELIVRGFDSDGQIREERILRFNAHDPIDPELIERSLNAQLRNWQKKRKHRDKTER